MTPESSAGGRREYDPGADPEMKLWVTNEIRDTRHALRTELAAIGAQVAASAMQSATEHAEVKALVLQLQRDVAALPKLTGRVEHLERDDAAAGAVAEATSKLRTSMRTTGFTLAGLIVAASGVIVAVVH